MGKVLQLDRKMGQRAEYGGKKSIKRVKD